MMVAYDFVVSAIGLGLICILTAPSLYSIWTQHQSKSRQHLQPGNLYEDQDGCATRESSDAHSDLVQRSILLVASILGLITSTVFVVLTTLDGKARCISHRVECQDQDNLIWLEQCLTLPVWVVLLTQALILFRTQSTVERYRLGVYGAISALVLGFTFSAQAIAWWSHKRSPPATDVYFGLVLIQFVTALVLTVTYVLIPRRPEVYQDGKVVDPQYTVSLLQRATFAWATPLLRLAVAKKSLDLEDLPMISHIIRSTTLRHNFENISIKYPVWKIIFWANKSAFFLQWTLTVFQSVSIFLPQIVLLYTLRNLEARDTGDDNILQLWLLALAFGLADTASVWLESSLFYVCFNRVGTPVYEQISSIVFAKALRKKDVKGVAKLETDGGPDDSNGEVIINKNAGTKGEDRAAEDESEDEGAKTKQSTINLIGVDGRRISDCAIYHCMALGSMLKITLALAFLVSLIGWIPLLAGFGTFSLLMVLNWWVTSSYMKAQDILMKVRDSKMSVISEALQGIRQIKFSALEKEWHDKIAKTRNKELKTQWWAFTLDAALLSIWIFGPVCLSAISLAVYAVIHKNLSPSVAFTTIAIFESIEVTLAVVPEVLSEAFDAWVSSKRIDDYLNSPDRENDIVPGEAIIFDNTSIAWPTDEKGLPGDTSFQLHGLDLAFPPGELSVISGKTGSGKSLLLASIVGEADIVGGQLTVPSAPSLAERFDHKATNSNWYIPSAIAYVSQIPWIENATIKDNILFGLPMDIKRYEDVIKASALEKDLEILQDGDMTDIGANGINLSGGQKWRVSLARALYSRAGILIFDDIFSAVDAHVGKHLYEKALTGPLGQTRTRILVTHHVALCLPRTKYSVLLENGAVLQAGLTEDLRRDGSLSKILSYDVEEQKKEDEIANAGGAVHGDDGELLQKLMSNRSDKARRVSMLSQDSVEVARTRSRIVEEEMKSVPMRFTEDEKRETGAVKLATYNAYIQAGGGYIYWALIMSIFLVANIAYLGRSYWVSVWTRSYHTESQSLHLSWLQLSQTIQYLQSQISHDQSNSDLSYYLRIYLAISCSVWIVGTIKHFAVYTASIRASRQLFDRLSYSILRAPLRFLDTTPAGRILNRFTADFNLVDSRLASDLAFSIHAATISVSVIIAGVFVSPYVLIAAAILLTICVWFARRYLTGAREIKRLESNAKSPVFEQFGSVLAGIGTIRAFGKAEAYLERMEKQIDNHCRAYFHLWLLTRWMSLRIGFVGSIFLTVMAALVVSITSIDASLAGFALSFSLQLSECIIWTLRQYANVELDMNAIERVVEYSTMPIEDQGGQDAPAAWPTKGEIEVDELVVSYAKGLQPVLKGLTFHVKPNERIGVVGRTGAGKSSLTLALFRFLEATSGTIHIDGIDITKIKLFDLRSRLAIIPQDPVLFSGTIRSNLDAFDQLEDAQLRDALARVHLIPSASTTQSGIATPHAQGSGHEGSHTPSNTNVFASLNNKISEGGLNLSQGQRQLLCLARAIVARPKIMVLDEATSSVDMETDALIQRSIREEFADSTLIVIAHRLSTIADFDRILVLGEGKVLEFDTPATLLAKDGGAFRSMVEESGERRDLEAIIRGTAGATTD